jgi:hypothetical protein
MHLIESYATSSGLKIGKPFILESYFPLPFEKYISFQPFSKYPAKDYDYWQEVINLILPHLKEQNIQIVQIGGEKEKVLQNTYNTVGQTNIRQAAYIIKNSIMHVGTDSFAAHIASGFGKKIVALYSNNNINNVKPYWTKEEDMILLSPEIQGKPSYAAQENPKSINNIKPEKIAQAILNLLKIKNNLNALETVYIGKMFNNKLFHIVPDHVVQRSNTIDHCIYRMDLLFNENNLRNQLKIMPCIIATDRPIDINILLENKAHIIGVNCFMQDTTNLEFVKQLKNTNIKYQLYSYLPNEELNQYKLDYLDYGIIAKVNLKHTKVEEIINKSKSNSLYYKSNNLILSKGNVFLSEKAFFDNKPVNSINENIQEFYDIKIINENPEKFYIFNMNLTQ